MSRDRHQLLQVELVEDDDAGLDGASEREIRPQPWKRLLARVPRRVWATVVVAALAVGGGVTVSRYAQEARETARLAAVAGLSTSLDLPLREAWRVPASGILAATADLLIVWEPYAEGVAAVDRVTGDIRYSLPGSCQVVVGDPPVAPTSSFAHATAGPDDLLLCVERRFSGLTDDSGVGDESAHLHAVGTGKLLRTIPMGTPDEWVIVDGDVVALGLDRDRHVTVSRWSLQTGERRWAFRSAEPAPTPGDGWMLTTTGTAVGYRMGDWSVMLDAATGTPLPPEAAAEPEVYATWGPMEIADGSTISGTFSFDGGSETTVDPADGEPFTVTGQVLSPSVDDGTADGMLLVADVTDDPGGPVLRSVDGGTGETRWTAQVDAGQVVALSGLVVVRDWLATTALDAATGDTRWVASSGATPNGFGPGWGLVTDGRRVLSLEVREEEWTLVARDVTTGEVVWEAPAPAHGGGLDQGPDGTVLLTGAADLVALRR